jgi:hypothetical protein
MVVPFVGRAAERDRLRFLVSLVTMALMRQATQGQPLLCVVTEAPSASASASGDRMQYRALGRTGIKVSPYALGALALGTSIGNPDQDDSVRIIPLDQAYLPPALLSLSLRRRGAGAR